MVVPNVYSDLIISQGLLSIFCSGFVFIPKGIFFSIQTETEGLSTLHDLVEKQILKVLT